LAATRNSFYQNGVADRLTIGGPFLLFIDKIPAVASVFFGFIGLQEVVFLAEKIEH
jgi:hypothetical protein